MSIKVLNRPAVLIGNRGSLISQTFTSNGTYNASDYSADGFNVVNVSVAGGGGNDNELKLLTGRVGDYTVPQEIGSIYNLRQYAFRADPYLKRIDFNNVTLIPSAVCSGCVNLSEIVCDNVEAIVGYSAFYQCSRIKSINFPKLKFIDGGQTFAGITDLRVIEFPELVNISATSLIHGSSAFLTSVSFPKCVNISGPFVGVGNRNLTSIATPNLVYVWQSAFLGLSLIEHFDVDNLFKIEGSANFSGCYALKSIYLKHFEIVPSGTFYSCYALSQADIKGVTSLYQNAFCRCSSLESAFFPLCSVVGNSCFSNCSSLSQVTLGCTSIGVNAFSNCTSLESLYMLTCSVPSLSANAFGNTPMADNTLLGHFGSIYVPSSLVASFKAATNWVSLSDRITALPSDYDSKFVYAYEFYNRTDLTSFPSEKLDAEYICNHAFVNCSYITGTAYFSKVKEIGANAFSSCYGLTSLNFPECYLVGRNAFSGCLYLTSASFPELIAAEQGAFTFSTSNSISYLEFPKLEYAASSCFALLRNLESINVPSLKVIDRQAFMGCYKLSSIYAPNVMYAGDGIFSQTSISYFRLNNLAVLSCFGWCSKLQEVYAPNAAAITAYCFENNQALSKVTFSNLYSIGVGAFRSCTKLPEINIDKVVGALGMSCFLSCHSLTKIRNFNADYVQDYCFANCTNLSKCLLAAWSFTAYVFVNCSKLSKLYLISPVPAMLTMSNIFSNTPMVNSAYLSGVYGSIYVPSALVSDYQNDSVWSWFADRFVGLADEEFQDVIDHWYDTEPNE